MASAPNNCCHLKPQYHWKASATTVELPKFTLEATHELNKPLTNVGMATAFTDCANFEGISDKKPLLISKVVQKALIEAEHHQINAILSLTIRSVPF